MDSRDAEVAPEAGIARRRRKAGRLKMETVRQGQEPLLQGGKAEIWGGGVSGHEAVGWQMAGRAALQGKVLQKEQ